MARGYRLKSVSIAKNMTKSIMEARYDELLSAYDGLVRTGLSPVCVKGGKLASCYASGPDDMGIYYFLPKFAYFFGISIGEAADLFFPAMAWGGAALGFILFFLYYRSWGTRLLMAAGMAILLRYLLKILDVYTFSAVAALVGIPSLLLLMRKYHARVVPLGGGIFLLSLLMGVANLFRIHSGTPVVILAATLILLHKAFSRRNKAAFLGLAAAGLLIPHMAMSFNVAKINSYLESQGVTSDEQYRSTVHMVWHQVYIGLGYLNNKYGVVYADGVSEQRAREIDPDVKLFSARYEKILRGAVFHFCLKYPGFVFNTLFAKLGVLLMYFLLFANYGLFAGMRNGALAVVLTRYSPALFFAVLPGLLVVPHVQYIFSFLALSMALGLECLTGRQDE